MRFQQILAPPKPVVVRLASFKTRYLSLFGEKVSHDKLDFNWTIEQDFKRFQLNSMVKLQEVVLCSNHHFGISGIQLNFTENISSPLFQSEDRNYKLPVKIDTSKEILQIEARLDDYSNENLIYRLRFVDSLG